MSKKGKTKVYASMIALVVVLSPLTGIIQFGTAFSYAMAEINDLQMKIAQLTEGIEVFISMPSQYDEEDDIYFGFATMRMDKRELIQPNWVKIDLYPKGRSILLNTKTTADCDIYENVFSCHFEPLNQSGDFTINITASWTASWGDVFIDSQSIDFGVGKWRNLTMITSSFIDDLRDEINNIDFNTNLLNYQGNDLLSVLLIRRQATMVGFYSTITLNSLPSKFNITVLRISGYLADTNNTQIELEINQSIPILQSKGYEIETHYIRTIDQMKNFFNSSANSTESNFTIFINTHGSYLPSPTITTFAEAFDWIQYVQNGTQWGRRTWINIGQGKPLQYLTWGSGSNFLLLNQTVWSNFQKALTGEVSEPSFPAEKIWGSRTGNDFGNCTKDDIRVNYEQGYAYQENHGNNYLQIYDEDRGGTITSPKHFLSENTSMINSILLQYVGDPLWGDYGHKSTGYIRLEYRVHNLSAPLDSEPWIQLYQDINLTKNVTSVNFQINSPNKMIQWRVTINANEKDKDYFNKKVSSPFLLSVYVTYTELPLNPISEDPDPDTITIGVTTASEVSYQPNNTYAFRQPTVDYIDTHFGLSMPDQYNVSYSWVYPYGFDSLSYYELGNGQSACGINIGVFNILEHSVLSGNASLYCYMGAIVSTWDVVIGEVRDALNGLYYSLRYEHPDLANKMLKTFNDLGSAFNQRNFTLCKLLLINSTLLANETYQMYEDPFKDLMSAQIELGSDLKTPVEEFFNSMLEYFDQFSGDVVDGIDSFISMMDDADLGYQVGAMIWGLANIMWNVFNAWGWQVIWIPLVGQIAGTLAWFIGSALSSMVHDLGTVLGIIITTLENWIVDLLTNIGNTIKSLLNVLGTVLRDLFNSIVEIIDQLENKIQEIINQVVSQINNFIGLVQDAINEILDLILEIRGEVIAYVDDAVEVIKNFVIWGLDALINASSQLDTLLQEANNNIQKSLSFLPELAQGLGTEFQKATQEVGFLNYIVNTLGKTDDAFDLASSISSTLSGTIQAETGVMLFLINPKITTEDDRSIYFLALKDGQPTDLSYLNISIYNSIPTQYYDLNSPELVKTPQTGLYKLTVSLPQDTYTIDCYFNGSAFSHSTNFLDVIATAEIIRGDIHLKINSVVPTVATVGEDFGLVVWTQNLGYTDNYVDIRISIISLGMTIYQTVRPSIYIGAEETKAVPVMIPIEWYMLPGDYLLRVEIIEPNGEIAVTNHLLKIQWGWFESLAYWSPALIIGGVPISIIVYVFASLLLGYYGIRYVGIKVKQKLKSKWSKETKDTFDLHGKKFKIVGKEFPFTLKQPDKKK